LDIAQQLLPGVRTTLLITVTVMPLAVLVAVAVAVTRLQSVPVLSRGLAFYVDTIRSTPLLFQLFFVFYILPFVGILVGPWPAAIGTLVLHFGAYQSEIVRAGIRSVPQTNIEAARVLGMSKPLTYRRVIAPLAGRVILPPMGNSLLELLKATVVVSLVSLPDVMFTGNVVIGQTFKAPEVLALITIFFVGVGYPANRLLRLLERRVRLP
jgi:polar amino acid transport system permease protein